MMLPGSSYTSFFPQIGQQDQLFFSIPMASLPVPELPVLNSSPRPYAVYIFDGFFTRREGSFRLFHLL